MEVGNQFRLLMSASDYDQSVAFYRDTMGLSLFRSWDRPSGRGSVFHMGPGLIEVVTGEGSKESPGFSGAVIAVNDVQAAYEEIVVRGADATEPLTAPWGHRMITVTAPDGLELIFIQEPSGD